MVHIWTTTTNFQPDTHYVIDDERYQEFLDAYRAGTDRQLIQDGLNQGWAKLSNENGEPI